MIRPDAPRPLHRRGPRPLLLHLMQGMQMGAMPAPGMPSWPGSLQEWQSWSASSPSFPGGSFLDGSFLADPELVAGIAAYRRHPYQRTLTDPPVLWEEGETRLLDYGPARHNGGAPILFVPSLVNRAYILDLMEDRSLLRFLAAQGHRPLLLDWGWPGPLERSFSLTDLIAGRLERAIRSVGQKVTLAGYCMGGLLALASALRLPDQIGALALLATPWDFHAPDPEPALKLARMVPLLRPVIEFNQALPVDAMQILFAQLDPGQIPAKYRNFAKLDPESGTARRFVALEDWLADGVPLAAPIALETLEHWYGSNRPMRGLWQIAGLPVDPRRVAVPTLVAVPERDKIVPAEQALPLAKLIPGAKLLRPRAGHISMVAGSRATEELWHPFSDWLSGLPRPRVASVSRLRKVP